MTTRQTDARAPVPGHVAWVARTTAHVPAPTPGQEERALLALVDAALEAGIGWLSVQGPSGLGALADRRGVLGGRSVTVVGAPGPGTSGEGVPAARGPAHPEPSALRLYLAPEGSGRRELVDAVRGLAEAGVRPKDVREATIADALVVPDVDLLVLTGGDRRVPDLLVWQVAYSEIVVLDDPWPQVEPALFHAAVAEYQRRDRRYGGLVAPR